MSLTTTESSFAAESSKHDPNYDPNYTRTFEQDSAPTPSQRDPEEEYLKIAQSNKFPENFENAIKLSNSNNINYKNMGAEYYLA